MPDFIRVLFRTVLETGTHIPNATQGVSAGNLLPPVAGGGRQGALAAASLRPLPWGPGLAASAVNPTDGPVSLSSVSTQSRRWVLSRVY